MPSDSPFITVEDAERLGLECPIEVTGALAPASRILDYGPLTEDHVRAAAEFTQREGRPLRAVPLPPNPIQRLRASHHRLAQLLALGTNHIIAAKICNYAPSRVADLLADPAFNELLAHYEATRDDQWADFIEVASALSMDFLGLLQQQLDENPERFTPSIAMDAIKLLADRTGHAPVTKNLNVNVNVDLAARLRAARERRSAIEGEVLTANG